MAYTSKFGIVLVVLAMVAVLFYGLQQSAGSNAAGSSGSIRLKDAAFIKPDTFPLFFGNAAFLVRYVRQRVGDIWVLADGSPSLPNE